MMHNLIQCFPWWTNIVKEWVNLGWIDEDTYVAMLWWVFDNNIFDRCLAMVKL